MQPLRHEAPLEKLLRIGKTDNEALRQFHTALLQSNIYVFGTAPQEHQSGEIIPAGASVQIRSWRAADGSPYIPIFTSLEILRHAATKEEPYLLMPCRDFMALTLGATLVVNPNSAFAYRLAPEHVRSLLEVGAIVGPIDSWVVEKTTEVFVAAAHDVPQAVLKEVAALLSTFTAVVRARLLYYQDPTRDPAPILLLVLQGDGDLRMHSGPAAELLVARLGKIVDVVCVETNSVQFGQFPPFYQR